MKPLVLTIEHRLAHVDPLARMYMQNKSLDAAPDLTLLSGVRATTRSITTAYTHATMSTMSASLCTTSTVALRACTYVFGRVFASRRASRRRERRVIRLIRRGRTDRPLTTVSRRFADQ